MNAITVVLPVRGVTAAIAVLTQKCHFSMDWIERMYYLENKLTPMSKLISLDDYAESVKEWASDKGILSPQNSKKQMLKVMEEVGEVAGALSKKLPTQEVQSEIGDCFVTLIILAHQLGLEPSECLRSAYDKIKNRKGRVENGVFIKENDQK